MIAIKLSNFFIFFDYCYIHWRIFSLMLFSMESTIDLTLQIYWQLLKIFTTPLPLLTGRPACNPSAPLLDHLSNLRPFFLLLLLSLSFAPSLSYPLFWECCAMGLGGLTPSLPLLSFLKQNLQLISPCSKDWAGPKRNAPKTFMQGQTLSPLWETCAGEERTKKKKKKKWENNSLKQQFRSALEIVWKLEKLRFGFICTE